MAWLESAEKYLQRSHSVRILLATPPDWSNFEQVGNIPITLRIPDTLEPVQKLSKIRIGAVVSGE